MNDPKIEAFHCALNFKIVNYLTQGRTSGQFGENQQSKLILPPKDTKYFVQKKPSKHKPKKY